MQLLVFNNNTSENFLFMYIQPSDANYMSTTC